MSEFEFSPEDIDRTTLRLPAGQFYNETTTKSLIVYHHTVGGSAASSVNWWKQDPRRVGTAYIIDRDGTVFEVFDPTRWAYHLGLKGTTVAGEVDRRSIGIELASEGGLTEYQGQLYCFDRVSPRTLFSDKFFDCGQKWRGYRYFDEYSPQQITALIGLTNYLTQRFPSILRQTPLNHYIFNRDLFGFRGVLGHHHLRSDKSDVHPGFPWDRVVAECKLALL